MMCLRRDMMPLTFAEKDKEAIIKKINGTPEIRQHLADMGFVVGGGVTVITSIDGNLIVSVKGARIALNNSMANKIII